MPSPLALKRSRLTLRMRSRVRAEREGAEREGGCDAMGSGVTRDMASMIRRDGADDRFRNAMGDVPFSHAKVAWAVCEWHPAGKLSRTRHTACNGRRQKPALAQHLIADRIAAHRRRRNPGSFRRTRLSPTDSVRSMRPVAAAFRFATGTRVVKNSPVCWPGAAHSRQFWPLANQVNAASQTHELASRSRHLCPERRASY